MKSVTTPSAPAPQRLRDLLADGLLLALPLGAAAFLLVKVLGLLKKLLVPVAHLLPNGRLLGIAAIEIAAVFVLLLALLALGFFARSRLGRRLAGSIERVVLSKIPGYLVVKSIAADLTHDEGAYDLRPALVTFDDNAVLGFVVEEAADAAMFTVFLPGAPGAASGSVVLMPRERVQLLDADTGGAMRAMRQRGIGLQALAMGRRPESEQ
ncbi:MAG TPA: DUF502 domain-containing protein [Lysobacter sp.]|nr:DUF502 domain-containing protein [Lysobacter sp.]